jgi:hypothetical protein
MVDNYFIIYCFNEVDRCYREKKMNYDSNEELYFSWWLDELLEAEIVLKYNRALPIQLSEPVKRWEHKKYITKVRKEERLKSVQKTILQAHIYTPDFVVLFRPNFAEKIGLDCVNTGLAIIEVKGNYDSNNMTRLFKINQKWVYSKTGELINLVKVPDIFEKTFTPKKYLLTDKTKKARRINFKVRTLEEFWRLK